MLSLFTSSLKKINAHLESINEMQSCFHHNVFFLIDPIIICSKQPSLSPLGYSSFVYSESEEFASDSLSDG